MIKDLRAREIIDSRGNPTVEVALSTDQGEFVSSIPSGASTGSHEAKELRDMGDRFGGKGVLRAVENINKIIKPLLLGEEVDDPRKLDQILLSEDGTEDKSNLGANAILGVSMSVFRAAAKKQEVPLFEYIAKEFDFTKKTPRPCFNVINGGAHSEGGTSFQEFMIVPQKDSFRQNLEEGVRCYRELKSKLKERYGEMAVNLGDEGGFVPGKCSAQEVMDLLSEQGNQVIIDAAATEFCQQEEYLFDGERKDAREMTDFYRQLSKKYPLMGLEDPLHENDFSGWRELTERLSDIMVIGDDLLTTNIKRMEMAKKEKACNGMILKINQIGSVSEALEAAKRAQDYKWKIIVSHRSGETNDDFIADLAVGIGADFIKSGAPARGERVAKYNRLLQIDN